MKQILALLLGMVAIIAGAGGKKLVERRPPDHPDSPANYGMRFERVRFYSRDDLLLHGWWIPAKNLASAKGTIIQCHGQNGSMDADIRQAAMLHDAGFNVLMFNFRAHGESEGSFVTFGLREQYDLLGAIDYLTGAHGIEEVGVLGFSMGAATAILTATRTKQIRTIVADGAIATLQQTLTGWLRGKNVPKELAGVLARVLIACGSLLSFTPLYRVNTLQWISRVNCPILFIHGGADILVATRDVRTLVNNAPTGSDWWVAPGCQHRQTHQKYPAEYEQRIIAWFSTYL